MHDITVGRLRYVVRLARQDSLWVAVAERAETGERYGAECSGGSEGEAVDRGVVKEARAKARAEAQERFRKGRR